MNIWMFLSKYMYIVCFILVQKLFKAEDVNKILAKGRMK